MTKEECKIEYENKNLFLSEEKCKQCDYYFTCIYMKMAMNENVYGDD